MPYEIVMHSPYGIEQLDCELADRRYAREQVTEHRMTTDYPVWLRFQRPTRYYVKASGGSVHTPTDLLFIKALVKEAGGKNVRTARQFGWINQPDVVTFSGYSEEERNVERKLRDEGYMILVHEKDW